MSLIALQMLLPNSGHRALPLPACVELARRGLDYACAEHHCASLAVLRMRWEVDRASSGPAQQTVVTCRYREVYELCQPGFRGRCTAPLVVDRHQRRLVSNESSDIVRMLNSFQVWSMARLGVPSSPLSSAKAVHNK